MGFYDTKSSSVSENEKFQNLFDMGILWTGLKPGVQNNLQNWKISKFDWVRSKKHFFEYLQRNLKNDFWL